MAQSSPLALDSKLSAKLLIGIALVGVVIAGVREAGRLYSTWTFKSSASTSVLSAPDTVLIPTEPGIPLKQLAGMIFEITEDVKVPWATVRLEELPSGEVYLDGRVRISESEVLIKEGRLFQRVPGEGNLWQDLRSGERSTQKLEGLYALWTPYFSRESSRSGVALGQEFRSSRVWLNLKGGTQLRVREVLEGGGMISIRLEAPRTENPHFNARVEKIVVFGTSDPSASERPVTVGDFQEIAGSVFELSRLMQ